MRGDLGWKLAGMAGMLALQGCLIITNGGSTQGSMTARWTFGTRGCAEAGVAQVQVTLTPRAGGGSLVGPTQVGCQDDTFSLSGIREGDYSLLVEGVTSQNIIIYDATRTILIVGGSNTDLGTVDLAPLLGTLTVDWLFQTPANTSTADCARAGVTDVEVELRNSSGQVVFDDLIPCPDGPSDIVNVEPDTYTVSMTGLGLYNALSVPLYNVSNVSVTVTRTTPAVLDPVPVLLLDSTRFANLQVHWAFGNNETCSSTGVQNLSVGIYRPGDSQPEDSFTAACSAPDALRTTFVPGNWRVVISGTGTAGAAYRGEMTVDAAPGQTQAFTVPLVRI